MHRFPCWWSSNGNSKKCISVIRDLPRSTVPSPNLWIHRVSSLNRQFHRKFLSMLDIVTHSMHTNEMIRKNIQVISSTNDHSMRSVAIFVLIIRDLTDLYMIRFVIWLSVAWYGFRFITSFLAIGFVARKPQIVQKTFTSRWIVGNWSGIAVSGERKIRSLDIKIKVKLYTFITQIPVVQEKKLLRFVWNGRLINIYSANLWHTNFVQHIFPNHQRNQRNLSCSKWKQGNQLQYK